MKPVLLLSFAILAVILSDVSEATPLQSSELLDDWLDNISDDDAYGFELPYDDYEDDNSDEHQLVKRHWVNVCKPVSCTSRCIKLLKSKGGRCASTGKCYCLEKL